MKSKTLLMTGTLLAALFSLPAMAQPGPGMGGMGTGMGGSGMGPGMGAGAGSGPGPGGKRGPRDCAQTPNPEQCMAHREARKQAAEACKDKAGADRRACIQSKMPPPDCSKAPNPQRCENRQKAREMCKDKTGPDHRQCLREASRSK